MKSLNSITKSIVNIIIFVLIIIWVANRLSNTHVNTATEFLDNYKNCVIVRKDKSTNNYILTIKNPYTQDIRYRITNVTVPSGLWYNYSIGDTIGKKKQIYFNQ
jgi:hypothetical protein